MERYHEAIQRSYFVTMSSQTPDEAINALGAVLRNTDAIIDTRFVAEDLANLRYAFPDDHHFAHAVFAVARAIYHVTVRHFHDSTPLHYQLSTWVRFAFPSMPGVKGTADLRLIFRPKTDGGVEILAFGHRHIPNAIYLAAKQRRLDSSKPNPAE